MQWKMGKGWKERQEQTAEQTFSKWEYIVPKKVKEKHIGFIVYE